MSTDPLRNTDLAKPSGWNAYAYVLNNPLKLYDPIGLLPEQPEPGECEKNPQGPGCQTPTPTPTHAPAQPSNQPQPQPVPTPVGPPPPPVRPPTIADLQTALDTFGMIPGAGEVADGLSGLIYTLRGDPVGAGLSFAAMIPTGGQLAGAGKLGRRFGKDAAALIDLARDAKRGGLSRQEADVLMNWAREYKVPYRNDIGTMHWVGGDHIHLGPVQHIPVNP